jgi:type VI secretion system protein ImpI
MPLALVARVFDTQANQQFEATFERFPVRIGRNQLNDLQIDRPYVSQFHAAIDLRDRQIFIRDLGSTNGTAYGGHRLQRDQPVDVTAAPEVTIGPIVMRLQLVEAQAKKPSAAQESGNMLDMSDASGVSALATLSQKKPIPPGGEDPFIRQVVPYLEAYRASWGAVYRVIYDHLTRLPPELRVNYIKRLGLEHQSVNLETDFQKIAQYYGVDPRTLGDLSPPQAALTALAELSRTLVPDVRPPEDVAQVVTFARRLRDTMEVFLKCFCSLRDGYKAFETEVLALDRDSINTNQVGTAKDAKELGAVLLGPTAAPEATRQVNDLFVDVMSHQVALMNGVMEGVKTLLTQLSPKAIEDDFERKGKKAGLFSNKYEALWKFYEDRHGDYSGEDKQTFLIIFGPQFSKAYAASAGEDYKSTGAAAGNNIRLTITPNQVKR